MNTVYILDIQDFIGESNQNTKEAFLNKYMPTVSHQRQEKVRSFYFTDDKIRSLAAYLLISRALSENYAVEGVLEFAVGHNGKPYLKNYKDIFFNISHCKNFVACIVGEAEVGIDIQDPFPFDQDIANYICSKEELKTLANGNTMNNKKQLNRIWVLKEAYIKFTGEGLLADLKKIDFSSKEKQNRQETMLVFKETALYNLAICIKKK